MTDPLLELQQVSVSYPLPRPNLWSRIPTLPVLSDISFSVQTGEALGIVGESGSGKSTLGRAIVRLIDVDNGRIRFDGVDIATMNCLLYTSPSPRDS